MGCDFFYSGNLPSPELQEKVVRFWTSTFRDPSCLVISPYDLPPVTTLFLRNHVTRNRDHRLFLGTPQPFQLFGVILISTVDGSLDDQGQLVFDRSRQGALVRVRRLPKVFGLKPNDRATDEQTLQGWLKSGQVHWTGGGSPQVDVEVEEGGHLRLLDDLMPMALLLNIMRIRWWPDLDLGDDMQMCSYVAEALAANPALASSLRDESKDFLECQRLFMAVRPNHPLEDIDVSALSEGMEDEEYLRLAKEVENQMAQFTIDDGSEDL
jgi:hypothetical protein